MFVTVQAIGHQQHRGVRAEQAARPDVVELVQAGGNARAAFPVVHLQVGLRQRHVGVAVLEAAGDVGQASAEGQRVDLQVAPRQAVHVVQQQPRVALHRAGDVEQHHQRGPLGARARVGGGQCVRLAGHALHRRAQVEPATVVPIRSALVAAPAHWLHRQRQFLGELLGQLELGGGHAFEIGLLQTLAVGEGEAGVEGDLFLRGGVGRVRRLRRPRCGERFSQAVGARLHRLVTAPADLGQQQVHQLFEQLGVAPERVECSVEQHLLLVAVDHHSAQRGMHVVAPVQPDLFNRGHRREHAVRPDRHAGAAQHAREVDDVLGNH